MIKAYAEPAGRGSTVGTNPQARTGRNMTDFYNRTGQTAFGRITGRNGRPVTNQRTQRTYSTTRG